MLRLHPFQNSIPSLVSDFFISIIATSFKQGEKYVSPSWAKRVGIFWQCFSSFGYAHVCFSHLSIITKNRLYNTCNNHVIWIFWNIFESFLYRWSSGLCHLAIDNFLLLGNPYTCNSDRKLAKNVRLPIYSIGCIDSMYPNNPQLTRHEPRKNMIRFYKLKITYHWVKKQK